MPMAVLDHTAGSSGIEYHSVSPDLVCSSQQTEPEGQVYSSGLSLLLKDYSVNARYQTGQPCRRSIVHKRTSPPVAGTPVNNLPPGCQNHPPAFHYNRQSHVIDASQWSPHRCWLKV
ncbi:hypothetical protein D3C76_915610 [compost metagenome]